MSSQLQSQLFESDEVSMDDANAPSGSNQGLTSRYQYTASSKIFDLEGPLYEHVFGIDKYIVNGVDIHLRLFINMTPFVLMSSEASPSYKLEIVDVAFKACMVNVESGFLINHAKMLKDTTTKYPLTRTEVKMSTCPSGSGTFIWKNVWSNNLPTKAFFGFVQQGAVNGNYTKNPFNFLNIAQEVAMYVISPVFQSQSTGKTPDSVSDVLVYESSLCQILHIGSG